MPISSFRFVFCSAILTLLALAHTANAQTFSMSCSATDTIRQGEIVLLTYQFDNVSAASFRLPELDGLRLLDGPSRRSQISIVNGIRSSSEGLTYRFIAEQAGTIEVPGVTLDAAQGALQAGPLRFYVSSDPNFVARPGAAQRVPGAQMPNSPPAPPKRRPTTRM